MNFLDITLQTLSGAETRMPKKLRDAHWERMKSRLIMAASAANLAMYREDSDNEGACEGSLEEELCEEPTTYKDMKSTLDELLAKQR